MVRLMLVVATLAVLVLHASCQQQQPLQPGVLDAESLGEPREIEQPLVGFADPSFVDPATQDEALSLDPVASSGSEAAATRNRRTFGSFYFGIRKPVYYHSYPRYYSHSHYGYYRPYYHHYHHW